MEMDFDTRDARLCHLCQALKQVGAIFLFWIEKAVAGRVPNRIAVTTRDSRPLVAPHRSAAASDGLVGLPAKRLKMIGNHQPDSRARGHRARRAAPDIPRKPQLCVTW